MTTQKIVQRLAAVQAELADIIAVLAAEPPPAPPAHPALFGSPLNDWGVLTSLFGAIS